MDADQVLAQLKSMGTAQNRKTYGRHGVPEPLFGVSYANLGKLTKQLGTNHELALELWQAEVHDARILATMIVDPAKITATQLDRWVRSANNHVLGDAVSKVAAQHKTALGRIEKWTKAKSEAVSAVGWSTLAAFSAIDDSSSDVYYRGHLQMIETSIHDAPNYTRHNMNQALISIGVRNPALQKEAIRVARAIGKVEVDHGQTSCKTPAAEAYIKKVVEHRKNKKKRK